MNVFDESPREVTPVPQEALSVHVQAESTTLQFENQRKLVITFRWRSPH